MSSWNVLVASRSRRVSWRPLWPFRCRRLLAFPSYGRTRGMSGGIIEEKAVHDALDALLRAREHPGADTTTNPSLKRCYPEDTDPNPVKRSNIDGVMDASGMVQQLGFSTSSMIPTVASAAETVVEIISVPKNTMSTNQRSSSSLSNLSDVSQESSDGLKRQRYGSTSFTDESYVSSHSNGSDFSSSDTLSSCGSNCRRMLAGRKKPEKLEPLVNNSVIGDYRIVGAGKDSRAVQLPTNKVVNYQVLTSQEAFIVSQVIARLDVAEN